MLVLIASTGVWIETSRPDVSWSFRYSFTLPMSCASCARAGLSQKITGEPVARARETARRTQSRIGASFVCHVDGGATR